MHLMVSAYDVVIIGAGVTGCAIARELSKYDLKTALLDKEAEASFGDVIARDIDGEGADLIATRSIEAVS